VAVGFPLAAVALLSVWLARDPAPPELTIWTLIVLPLICAAYGFFPLAIGARTSVTFEAPTILLAGLVGGPIAGVLAGIGAGLGDVNAVWRRRSAYAGLAMLHGFAAGQVGNTWRAGAIPLVAAVALAGLAYIAIGTVGLALVQVDRGAWSMHRLAGAVLVDAGELLVWAPLLVLFARSFSSSPGLTSLALGSALGVVAFGAWALTTQRALVEHERRAWLSDPLTGALSRVAFEAALEREHASVLRGERPAGLILCDVDHFRLLNERHGHLGGDEVLRLVVGRVRIATRSADVVARWGGDEVCVITPGTGTPAELESVCEQIRLAVADAPLPAERVGPSTRGASIEAKRDVQPGLSVRRILGARPTSVRSHRRQMSLEERVAGQPAARRAGRRSSRRRCCTSAPPEAPQRLGVALRPYSSARRCPSVRPGASQ
jgi:diguanylate cyclase (GGDEF)-like protein